MVDILGEKKISKNPGIVSTEMQRLFMEISLIGMGNGFKLEAFHLLRALRIADPGAAYPLLALAQLHIFHDEMEEAKRVLLDLELSPHGQDPWIVKIIQAIQLLGAEFVQAVNKSLSDSSRCKGNASSSVAIMGL